MASPAELLRGEAKQANSSRFSVRSRQHRQAKRVTLTSVAHTATDPSPPTMSTLLDRPTPSTVYGKSHAVRPPDQRPQRRRDPASSTLPGGTGDTSTGGVELPPRPEISDTTPEAVASYLISLCRLYRSLAASGERRRVVACARTFLLKTLRTMLAQPPLEGSEGPRDTVHLRDPASITPPATAIIPWSVPLAHEVIRAYDTFGLRINSGGPADLAAKYLYGNTVDPPPTESDRHVPYSKLRGLERNVTPRAADAWLDECINRGKLSLQIHKLLQKELLRVRFLREKAIPSYMAGSARRGVALPPERLDAVRQIIQRETLHRLHWVERYYTEALLPEALRNLKELCGGDEAMTADTPLRFSPRELEAFTVLLSVVNKAVGSRLLRNLSDGTTSEKEGHGSSVAFVGPATTLYTSDEQEAPSVKPSEVPCSCAPRIPTQVLLNGLQAFCVSVGEASLPALGSALSRVASRVQQKTSAVSSRFECRTDRFDAQAAGAVATEDGKVFTARARNFNVDLLFPVLQFFTHPSALPRLSCPLGAVGRGSPLSADAFARNLSTVLHYVFEWLPMMRSYQLAAAASIYTRLITTWHPQELHQHPHADAQSELQDFHRRSLMLLQARLRNGGDSAAALCGAEGIPSPALAVVMLRQPSLQYLHRFTPSDAAAFLSAVSVMHKIITDGQGEAPLSAVDGYRGGSTLYDAAKALDDIYTAFSVFLSQWKLKSSSFVTVFLPRQVAECLDGEHHPQREAIASSHACGDDEVLLTIQEGDVADESARRVDGVGSGTDRVASAAPRQRRVGLRVHCTLLQQLGVDSSTLPSAHELKVISESLCTIRSRAPVLSTPFALAEALRRSQPFSRGCNLPFDTAISLVCTICEEVRACRVEVPHVLQIMAALWPRYSPIISSFGSARTAIEDSLWNQGLLPGFMRELAACSNLAEYEAWIKRYPEYQPSGDLSTVSDIECRALADATLEALLSVTAEERNSHRNICINWFTSLVLHYQVRMWRTASSGSGGSHAEASTPLASFHRDILLPFLASWTVIASHSPSPDSRTGECVVSCKTLCEEVLARHAATSLTASPRTDGVSEDMYKPFARRRALQRAVNIACVLEGSTTVPAEALKAVRALAAHECRATRNWHITAQVASNPPLAHSLPPWLAEELHSGLERHCPLLWGTTVPVVLFPLLASPMLQARLQCKDDGTPSWQSESLLVTADVDVFSDDGGRGNATVATASCDTPSFSEERGLRIALQTAKRFPLELSGLLLLLRSALQTEPQLLRPIAEDAREDGSTAPQPFSRPGCSAQLREAYQTYTVQHGARLLHQLTTPTQSSNNSVAPFAAADACEFLTFLVNSGGRRRESVVMQVLDRLRDSDSDAGRCLPSLTPSGFLPLRTVAVLLQSLAACDEAEASSASTPGVAGDGQPNRPSSRTDRERGVVVTSVLHFMWPALEVSLQQTVFEQGTSQEGEDAAVQVALVVLAVSRLAPDRLPQLMTVAYTRYPATTRAMHHRHHQASLKGNRTKPVRQSQWGQVAEWEGMLHALLTMTEAWQRHSGGIHTPLNSEADEGESHGNGDDVTARHSLAPSAAHMITQKLLDDFRWRVLSFARRVSFRKLSQEVDCTLVSQVLAVPSARRHLPLYLFLASLLRASCEYALGAPLFYGTRDPRGGMALDATESAAYYRDASPPSDLQCVLTVPTARDGEASALPQRLRGLSVEAWTAMCAVRVCGRAAPPRHLSDKDRELPSKKKFDRTADPRRHSTWTLQRTSPMAVLALLPPPMVRSLAVAVGPVPFVRLATHILHSWLAYTPDYLQKWIGAFSDAYGMHNAEGGASAQDISGDPETTSQIPGLLAMPPGSPLRAAWLQPWLNGAWTILQGIPGSLHQSDYFCTGGRSSEAGKHGRDTSDAEGHAGETVVLDMAPLVAFTKKLEAHLPHLTDIILRRIMDGGETPEAVAADPTLSFSHLLQRILAAVLQGADPTRAAAAGRTVVSMSSPEVRLVGVESLLRYHTTPVASPWKPRHRVHAPLFDSSDAAVEGDGIRTAAESKAVNAALVAFRTAQQSQLDRLILEDLFESCPTRREAEEKGNRREDVMLRGVRRRLAAFQATDLSAILQLLLVHRGQPGAIEGGGTYWARCVTSTAEALTETLPTSSASEMVSMVLSLLPLWRSLRDSPFQFQNMGNEERKVLLHELRRLLATVPLIIAHDMGRFQLSEMITLLLALHTPLLDCQTPAMTSPPSSSTHTQRPWDHSFCSHEAARSLRLAMTPEARFEEQARFRTTVDMMIADEGLGVPKVVELWKALMRNHDAGRSLESRTSVLEERLMHVLTIVEATAH